VAYVPNLKPLCGSNFCTARSNPKVPSCMIRGSRKQLLLPPRLNHAWSTSSAPV
jgi:hypothetical protein